MHIKIKKVEPAGAGGLGALTGGDQAGRRVTHKIDQCTDEKQVLIVAYTVDRFLSVETVRT